MGRTTILSLAALLAATVALDEDIWVKKEYMQWTYGEVKKLLTNSPWAKDVTVSVPPAVLGGADGQLPAAAPSGIDVEKTAGGP